MPLPAFDPALPSPSIAMPPPGPIRSPPPTMLAKTSLNHGNTQHIFDKREVRLGGTRRRGRTRAGRRTGRLACATAVQSFSSRSSRCRVRWRLEMPCSRTYVGEYISTQLVLVWPTMATRQQPNANSARRDTQNQRNLVRLFRDLQQERYREDVILILLDMVFVVKCSHRPIPSDFRSAGDVTEAIFKSESSSLRNPPRPPVPFVVGDGALPTEVNVRCFMS